MIVRVRDLRFRYPGGAGDVLGGLDFDINEGEIFGFLGPNGSGKSTTQRVLTRILPAYRGTVEVFDKDLGSLRSDYYNHIGVSFEFPNLYEKLTAEENLEFYRGFFDVPTDEPRELLERFERRDVSLISVAESLDTGTAAGRLVLNVMASVSQWEREVIGERTREALAHKKAQGHRIGTGPFGYALADDGRTLIPQSDEQATLDLLRDCRAAGFSLRATASELNRHGCRTRSGAPWRHEYVRNLLNTAA